MTNKIFAIIAAGGSGKRMGQPKQLMNLLGKPMLEWTVEAFKQVSQIAGIVIVGPGRGLSSLVCESGQERTDSVRNGLALVPKDTDIVLIHDGARPLITPEIIRNSIEECGRSDAVVVGVPVKDTIKQVTRNKIQNTIDRNLLWAAQTPQVFKYSVLIEAYRKAKDDLPAGKAGAKATDDAKLVEDLGIPVKMIMGSYENIKVTTPEDLIFAETILCSRQQKKNS